MQPTDFSRIEKAGDLYVSYHRLGGCVTDPTKRGVQLQIDYWSTREEDWKEWVSLTESMR